MTRNWSAWARRAFHSRPCPPSRRGRARRHCCRGPRLKRPPRCSRGIAATRTGRNRPYELRTCSLDRGLEAARPGHHGTQAVPTGGPHSAGVHGGCRHHGAHGGLPGAIAGPRSLPGCAALPTRCNTRTDVTRHGGTAVRRRSGATGGRWGKLCPPPPPDADHGQYPRAATRCAPPVACHAP